VFLGLIGTVVDIVIALSAVDPDAVADPAKVAPMVAELLDGMGVALTTTLVGVVLHLWPLDRRRGDRGFGNAHQRQSARDAGLTAMQSEFDDPFQQDSGGTVFRDVVLLALIGFVAMLIMILPHINPPKTENTADHRAPGNVIFELHWPNNLAYDIDLWVQAPKGVPVGFWNSTGRVFSLLRDDLGITGNATEWNYEVAYSKGIPAGE
jgi:hypothetical protein